MVHGKHGTALQEMMHGDIRQLPHAATGPQPALHACRDLKAHTLQAVMHASHAVAAMQHAWHLRMRPMGEAGSPSLDAVGLVSNDGRRRDACCSWDRSGGDTVDVGGSGLPLPGPWSSASLNALLREFLPGSAPPSTPAPSSAARRRCSRRAEGEASSSIGYFTCRRPQLHFGICIPHLKFCLKTKQQRASKMKGFTCMQAQHRRSLPDSLCPGTFERALLLLESPKLAQE